VLPSAHSLAYPRQLLGNPGQQKRPIETETHLNRRQHRAEKPRLGLSLRTGNPLV